MFKRCKPPQPLFKNLGVFTVRFGSVFIKKSNQTEFFFKKKNRNRFKPTGFGSVRFFREKTGSNRFGSVFSVWLGFGSVFSVWLGFFPVFFRFGSVQFFRFQAYKTETEPVGFFKILIGFFLRFGFFGYFFPVFSV